MATPNNLPVPAATGSGIGFGTRTEMFPPMPLPEFNAVGGPGLLPRKAKGDTTFDLIAILCNRGLPPRTDFIRGDAEHRPSQ